MIGMPLMVLLGLAVRDGATPVDAWLQQIGGGPRGHGPLASLLVFTDYRTAQTLLLIAAAAAIWRRRWALLPVVVIVPVVSVWVARALKSVFGRFKGEALAYPSGHTTLMVVVLGVLILAIGVRRWLLWTAAVFAALGILGQSVSYHYFTDAMGALLLGTSLLCLITLAMRWLHLRL